MWIVKPIVCGYLAVMSTQLTIRFNEGADLVAGAAFLKSVPGVILVDQVFPNHERPEYRLLFVVAVYPAAAEQALVTIALSDLVAEVARAAERRPMAS